MNPGRADVRVVLVGVDQQDDSRIPSLSQTATDVVELSAALETAGIRNGVNGTVVESLCSRSANVVQRPTGRNILQTLQKQSRAAQDGDVLLFYFSGHAVKSDGQAALVPCDATATGKGLVPVANLRSEFEKSQARHKLVIIDSCFSGSFSGFGPLAPVTEAFVGSNVYAITSSQDDQLSVVWPSREQSLATRWLCHGLRGAADRDLDGRISMDELFGFVRSNVSQCFPVVLDEIGQRSAAGQLLFRQNQRSQTPQRMIGPPWSDPQLFEMQPLTAHQAVSNLAEQLADRITVAGRHLTADSPARVAVLPASSKVGNRLVRGQYPVLEQLVGPELSVALMGASRGRYELLSWQSVQLAMTKGFDIRSVATQERRSFQRLRDELRGEVDFFVDVRMFLRGSHLVLQAELLSSSGGAVAFTTSLVVQISGELRVALDDFLKGTNRRLQEADPPNPQPQSEDRDPIVRQPPPPARERKESPLRVTFETTNLAGTEAWHKVPIDADGTISVANGRKLKIVVENQTDRHLAAVVYVDGINILGKKPQTPHEALKNAGYWIVPPRFRGRFSSWTQRMNSAEGESTKGNAGLFEAEEFIVTNAPQSVAGQLSYVENLGDIRLCIFETQHPNTKGALTGRGIGVGAAEKKLEQLQLHRRAADPNRHITNLVFKYVQK